VGDLETSIKLTLETGKSLSNLNNFASAFRRQMRDIGKTDLEIDWIEHLAEEVRTGQTALASLLEEMRGFVTEFNSGRQVAADRDALGLSLHAELSGVGDKQSCSRTDGFRCFFYRTGCWASRRGG
jgi:hypothetical protein